MCHVIKYSNEFKDDCESLALVIQHIAWFGVHDSSEGGDIMYLMHHVILNDHLIERSCKFTGWSSFQHVTILISLSDHKHCDSEDIKLICHVTSHEHMFDGLLRFIGGSPSH